MDSRKPNAAPYILAAVAIAATIWTAMGVPHDSPRTVKQYAGRVAVP
jgi:hypothetical protein